MIYLGVWPAATGMSNNNLFMIDLFDNNKTNICVTSQERQCCADHIQFYAAHAHCCAVHVL
jgi:hypothetical protein